MASDIQKDQIRVTCPNCRQRHLMTLMRVEAPVVVAAFDRCACCRVEIRVYWNFVDQIGVLRVDDVLGDVGAGIELVEGDG